MAGDGVLEQKPVKTNFADLSSEGLGPPDTTTKKPARLIVGDQEADTRTAKTTVAQIYSAPTRGAQDHPAGGPDDRKSYDPNKKDFSNDSPVDWAYFVGAGLGAAKNFNNIGKLESRNWYQRIGKLNYLPGDKSKSKDYVTPREHEGVSAETEALLKDYRKSILGDGTPTNLGAIEAAKSAPTVTPQRETVLTAFKPQVQRMFDYPGTSPHFSDEAPWDKGLPDTLQRGPHDLSNLGDTPLSGGRTMRVGMGPVDVDSRHGGIVTVQAMKVEITGPPPIPPNFKTAEWLPGMVSTDITVANENMVVARQLSVAAASQRQAAYTYDNLKRATEYESMMRGRRMSAEAEVGTFALAEGLVYGIDYLVPRDQISGLSTTVKAGGPFFMMTITGKEGSWLGKYGVFVGALGYVGLYAYSREFQDKQSDLLKQQLANKDK